MRSGFDLGNKKPLPFCKGQGEFNLVLLLEENFLVIWSHEQVIFK